MGLPAIEATSCLKRRQAWCRRPALSAKKMRGHEAAPVFPSWRAGSTMASMMGTGALHRCRRLAALVALSGVALYTALVPGHVVSQSTAAITDAGTFIQASATPDCHGELANDPAAPDGPTAPKKKCPFCKGSAAFQVALMAAPDAGILDAALYQPVAIAADRSVAHTVLRLPQNRGPPFEL